MLSARSEDVDKVRGLETGADDYVVKPYSVDRTDGPRAQPAAPCAASDSGAGAGLR